MGGLLSRRRHLCSRHRACQQPTVDGRRRCSARADAQRRGDRDGDRHPGPRVPRPHPDWRRSRRAGLDGADRRESRLADDAPSRVRDGVDGLAAWRARHRRWAICEAHRRGSRLAARRDDRRSDRSREAADARPQRRTRLGNRDHRRYHSRRSPRRATAYFCGLRQRRCDRTTFDRRVHRLRHRARCGSQGPR